MNNIKATGPASGATEFDINLPTPEEMAAQLQPQFNQDQAETIAAEVYQPLREMLRDIVLRDVR